MHIFSGPLHNYDIFFPLDTWSYQKQQITCTALGIWSSSKFIETFSCYAKAPCEAEAQCAAICKSNKAWQSNASCSFSFCNSECNFYTIFSQSLGLCCGFRRYGFINFWSSKIGSSFDVSKFQKDSCDGIWSFKGAFILDTMMLVTCSGYFLFSCWSFRFLRS